MLHTWASAAFVVAQTVVMLAWWFYDALEVLLVRQRERLVATLAGHGAAQWLLAVDLVLLALLGFFAARMWRRLFGSIREFASSTAAVLSAICAGLSIAVPALVFICLFGTLLELAARDHPSIAQLLSAATDICLQQKEKLWAEFSIGEQE